MTNKKVICSIKFEKDVICQICGYTHPTTIQNHIRFKHPEIKPREYMKKYGAEITSEVLKKRRAEKSAVANKGKKASKETKLKLSESGKARWANDPEARKKMAEITRQRAKDGTHPSQTEEFRKKASENAIKRNKTVKQKEAVKKALTGRKLPPEQVEKSAAGHRGIPLSEETKRKISAVHRKAFADGTRKTTGKFIGKYWSIKNNKYIHYRSKLELKYMEQLEGDDTVNEYKTDYPCIPYEVNGEKHTYLPDFLINNKNLIEVNSYNVFYLNKTKKEAKAEAARKYCAEHNLTYKILYEDDLGIEYNIPQYIKNYSFPHK